MNETNGDTAGSESEQKRPRVNKILLFALKFLLGAALVTYMASKGHLSGKAIISAWTDGKSWLLIAYVSMLLLPAVGGVRWWMMMHAQNMPVPLLSAIRLTYIGSFFSTFLPGSTSGDIVRMYGAASSFPDRKPAAVLTVLADRATGFLALWILACGVMAFNYDAIVQTPLVKQAALAMLILMVLTMVILCLVLSERLRKSRREFLSRPGKFRQVLRNMDEALAIYRNKRMVFVIAVGLSLLAHLMSVVAIFCAARAVGEVNIDFRRYMFIVPLALAVNAIPISPGGVGQGESFTEALVNTQGSSLGGDAFIVYRVVMMVAWVIAIIPYLAGNVRFKEMVETEQLAEEELSHLSPEEIEIGTDSPSQG